MPVCHATWGKEPFSCAVPPNMHVNTHTRAPRHTMHSKELAGAFKYLCNTSIAS